MRVSHQDLQDKLTALSEELLNTNMELDKSQQLAATLENDLEKVQQEAVNNFPTAMSVAGTHVSRYPHSSYKSTRGRPTSPTSSIISGFESQGTGTLDGLRQSDSPGGSSILPMVTAQRDRFKKKITELEGELQKSYQSIQSLRSEIAALQKDNLKLYEKTRYVSSYNRNASGASPTAIQIDNNPNFEPTFHRYKSAYEANMSPFSQFKTRESARAIKRMTLPERLVLQIARMVLATRISRNLFAMYCLGLHMLVLMTLFHLGDSKTHGITLVKTSVHDAGPASGPLAPNAPV
jgi:homeobox protein cut-like